MKRPPILDPSPTPRRKRVLSGDEVELWDSVAKGVRPLRGKRRAAKSEVIPAAELAAIPPPKAVAPPSVVSIPAKPPEPPLAVLGRRERSQISRGKKEIEGRLDLHGMTQTRAHRVLFTFLQRSQEEGKALVLVITGKGRTTGSDSERGILRRQVPQWLGLSEFRHLVVGFEQAHVGHGGEGALYVRIRRAR